MPLHAGLVGGGRWRSVMAGGVYCSYGAVAARGVIHKPVDTRIGCVRNRCYECTERTSSRYGDRGWRNGHCNWSWWRLRLFFVATDALAAHEKKKERR